MSAARKYVFLDADGVLNNYSDTPGSYMTHTADGYGMSESNMARVKTLCKECGASIVISSNWRKQLNGTGSADWSYNRICGGRLENPLKRVYEYFGDMIIDRLPGTERHMTKSEALDEWIAGRGLGEDDIAYVIFDDDPDEGYAENGYGEHLVMTDSEFGVTSADIEKAKGILEKNG